MRSYRNPFSTFGQSLMISRDEIEDACLEALKTSNSLPDIPGAIDVERFIEKHFNLRVEYRNELDDGVLGCTQFDKSGKPVRVIIGDSEGTTARAHDRRIRSTTAHEAGHALLHPVLFMKDLRQGDFGLGKHYENIDFEQNRILCRSDDLSSTTGRRYDGRWWEWQANQAIGGFLLPKPLVLKSLDDDLEKHGILQTPVLAAEKREDCAQKLAEVFDVNPVVGRIRLSILFPEGDASQMML